MATITITLNGMIDGQAATKTHVGTIDDTVIPSFFACFRGKVLVTPATQNPETGQRLPAVYRAMTDSETFEAFASSIAQGASDQVMRYVKDQATAQAISQVKSISVTKVS